MSNQFINCKAAARPLGRRALKRQLMPSPRQKARIVAQLKDDAAREVRKGLEQRLAEEPSPEPVQE
jgi:hypothetical protein